MQRSLWLASLVLGALALASFGSPAQAADGERARNRWPETSQQTCGNQDGNLTFGHRSTFESSIPARTVDAATRVPSALLSWGGVYWRPLSVTQRLLEVGGTAPREVASF